MIKAEYCPIRGLVSMTFEKPQALIDAEKNAKRGAKNRKRDKYGRFTK